MPGWVSSPGCSGPAVSRWAPPLLHLVGAPARTDTARAGQLTATEPRDALPKVRDVRNADEREQGVLRGSLHISLAELTRRFDEVPTDRPLVVRACCTMGDGFSHAAGLAGGAMVVSYPTGQARYQGKPTRMSPTRQRSPPSRRTAYRGCASARKSCGMSETLNASPLFVSNQAKTLTYAPAVTNARSQSIC